MNPTDQNLFETLYREKRNYVYRVLMRFSRDPDLSEDLTQEVFVNIYRSLNTFDPDRNAVSSWIYRITANVFYKHQTRNAFRKIDLLDETSIGRIPEQKPDHTSVVDGEIERKKILEVLKQMPEPEKSIILLKKIQKKTFSETAQILGISDRTVQRRLIKGLEILKQELSKSGIEP